MFGCFYSGMCRLVAFLIYFLYTSATTSSSSLDYTKKKKKRTRFMDMSLKFLT